jgi:tetratricopeptide (TPR) repeat protein
MSNGSPAPRAARTFPVRRVVFLCAVIPAVGLAVVYCGLWSAGHLDVRSALAARDYDRAEAGLARLSWLPPRSAEMDFLAARLERKRSNLLAVPRLLEKAGARGFDRRRIHGELLLVQAQAGDLAGVAEELNLWLQDPGGDGAEICEAYVNGAMITGDTAVALTILQSWKAEYPGDPQPFYAEGRRADHLGQSEAAERAFREAVARQPRHWPARYALGRVLLDGNRVDEAIVEYTAATAMRLNAAPRLGRARCLRSRGELEAARAELEALTTLAGTEIGESFQRVGEPERGKPIELELGLLLSERQEYAAALPWLDRVLQHDGRQLEARYARSVALRGTGDLARAEQELAEVQRIRELVREADRLVDEVRRNPAHPQVAQRLRIGEIFITESHGVRGEFWLRDVLRRDPGNRRAHQLLADYYRELSASHPGYRVLVERHRKLADEPAPNEDAR